MTLEECFMSLIDNLMIQKIINKLLLLLSHLKRLKFTGS